MVGKSAGAVCLLPSLHLCFRLIAVDEDDQIDGLRDTVKRPRLLPSLRRPPFAASTIYRSIVRHKQLHLTPTECTVRVHCMVQVARVWAHWKGRIASLWLHKYCLSVCTL
ncbi:uncharacterized protein SCHCODRAFT_02629596 [Schizophyllum commune H4-8]|uniref:uncharacterized protein n=1 Tax=Schizophyllum commune (strain H4-8 / FGSC 9210) TaxID=578458 RepID=UPI002160D94B|nr:uncharacterized protein SCHCODRAFT_02629596 [Schizophyllum commune H4-8]KAI5891610.1 hypothetical protein SCHCODRAFT_02629596 [Schizophyllum commune H4-8]